MKLNPDQIATEEVTQWQGLHLFHYQMSSCSQKVRILLGELGVEFQSHHIDLRREEQKSAWYTGINPNGVVPTLVHNGDVHIESNDIIQYINAEFASPEKSLLPQDTSARQQMQTLLDLEDRLHTDLRTVTFTYLAPDIHGGPNLDDTTLAYIGRFHDAFCKLDKILQQQAYLSGPEMTLTDISWFITLHRLSLARYPLHKHAALQAYYQKLAGRPAFKTQVASGPLLLRCAGVIYRNLRRLKKSLAVDFQKWAAQNA